MPAAAARRRRGRKGRKRGAGRSTSLGSFNTTAYGPPWDAMNGTGVTSTGVDLRDGKRRYLIAVDPSVIPYGTLVRIQPNPYGTTRPFVAADTGGAIVGKRIDFYVAEGRAKQLAWGEKPARVFKAGSVSNDPAQLGKAASGTLAGFALPNPGGLPIPGLGPGDDSPLPDLDIPNPLEGIEMLAQVVEGIAQFFIGLGELLLTPEGWLRIGKLLLGVLLLLGGVLAFAQAALGGKVRLGGAVKLGRRGIVGAVSSAAKS